MVVIYGSTTVKNLNKIVLIKQKQYEQYEEESVKSCFGSVLTVFSQYLYETMNLMKNKPQNVKQ